MPLTKNNTKLPGRFSALVELMPPRAIVDDVQLDNTIEMIDRLMALNKLTKDQGAYMETLVQLVQAYEAQHHAIDVSDIGGVDSLRYVMNTSGTSVADLARLLGVHVTLVYKILSGERSLTVDHIKILAKRFKARPDLFM